MAESVGPAKQGVVGDIQLSWENPHMVILDRPQCQRNPCGPGPTHRKSWRVMNALKFQGDDRSRRGKFRPQGTKNHHEAIGAHKTLAPVADRRLLKMGSRCLVTSRRHRSSCSTLPEDPTLRDRCLHPRRGSLQSEFFGPPNVVGAI